MKGTPWEYIFFVDFEGHTADEPIEVAMNDLKGKVLFMKVLGSYPMASKAMGSDGIEM